MSISFEPTQAPILLPTIITGTRIGWEIRLAIDTGATHTLIRASLLASLGIRPESSARRGRVRSATGGTTAPIVNLSHLLVLGQGRADFPVVAYDMPPSVTYDGLLGLDFFRGLILTLDFARGRIMLREPKSWWRFWN